jgi:hypothetical protein
MDADDRRDNVDDPANSAPEEDFTLDFSGTQLNRDVTTDFTDVDSSLGQQPAPPDSRNVPDD